MSVTIYHGTKFMPSKAVVSAPFGGLDKILQYPLKAPTTPRGGFFRGPSITAVLSASEAPVALYKWQMEMIANNGLAGFRKMMSERVKIGTTFHWVVGDLVEKSSREEGFFYKNSDDSLLEQITLPSAQGYLRSVLPFLRSLNLDSGVVRTEGKVLHAELLYAGRFDAIINYKGHSFLVDWKTASTGSYAQRKSKQVFDTPSDRLLSMFSYPMQVAAYAGAYNTENEKKITNGAVILAHEDGSECDVVEMEREQMEEQWHLYLKRLHKFWTIANDAIAKERTNVDVVYRG